ncbi:MAG: ABC-F family ATP-binding cassette domain-containing protein [Nitrospina sp.]|nr:ABC-F family ATP-binding cassette domain-containing protein [Nitrospina sp.]MBT3508074.1 ABC-F family ATP-binding cassette domain-containing protein [Nitrospina sp.]MBT3876673.1 ABC-F family ATP-binding cassette domain-containing protein [Nitrospina sp.]MBT4049620.1 ABC-F family ATP-binding cassette domain-containing protein [Nitrospina sp.]MBT4558332.1 ABC-F family ATP-binding cassette domain-containing protein [Nitrospina sp.]
MIFVEKVNLQFGSKILFEDVSFHLRPKEKVGLVGENGTGKTTLFKVITGKAMPDSGKVILRKGLRFGLLEQDLEGGRETVLERVVLGDPHFLEIKTEMERLESGQAYHDRYGDLQHEFERLGGYDREARAKTILLGLGIKPEKWDQPLDQLSGGWRMRCELSRLLLQGPDVLLLDEPSNHLDLRSVVWLESFLRAYEGSVLLISHDRRFLNSLASRIVELDRGRLSIYTGNYDDYENQKREKAELLESQAANQSRKIAEVERFIERFRAKNTKATQVQSRIKMLDKMERVQTTQGTKTIHFRFPQPVRTGRNVLEVAEVDKSYGSLKVYESFSINLERGWKVALVGENGAGKSTLLKLMAGALQPDKGEIKLGANVSRSYFAQHQGETLNFNHTVFQSLEESAPGLLLTEKRNILGAFLFAGDDVEKKVSVLSGGERSRLALARMLCGGTGPDKLARRTGNEKSHPPSFILFDEPTNHLDMRSREHLAAVLSDYEGSLVVISHDRFFLDGFINRVWEVEGGVVKDYTGHYSNYEWAKSKEAEDIVAPSGSTNEISSSKLGKEKKRKEAEERNLRYKNLKPLQKRLVEVESRLEGLMQTKEDLQTQLADTGIYEAEQKSRLMETLGKQNTLKAEEKILMEEWDSITVAIEQIENPS